MVDTLRVGEKRIIDSPSLETNGETLTITAVTVTLYDRGGTVQGGISDVDATGWVADPSTAPFAWYELDTAGLAPGYYVLSFRIVDQNDLIYEPFVLFQIVERYAVW